MHWTATKHLPACLSGDFLLVVFSPDKPRARFDREIAWMRMCVHVKVVGIGTVWDSLVRNSIEERPDVLNLCEVSGHVGKEHHFDDQTPELSKFLWFQVGQYTFVIFLE